MCLSPEVLARFTREVNIFRNLYAIRQRSQRDSVETSRLFTEAVELKRNPQALIIPAQALNVANQAHRNSS